MTCMYAKTKKVNPRKGWDQGVQGLDERLLAGNLSQDAAHDLSRSRLWQPCDAPMSLKEVHPSCTLVQQLSENELAQQGCTPPIIYACMQPLAFYSRKASA